MSVTFEILNSLFGNISSSNPSTISDSETKLQELSRDPTFVQTLVQFLAQDTADPAIRQAGSIYLKNYIKKQWDVSEEHGGVRGGDRQFIKKYLISLLLVVPKASQTQLSEAVQHVAVSDFPEDWRDLLPDIVKQHIKLDNVGLLSRAMSIVSSVLWSYRMESIETSVIKELKYILEQFAGAWHTVFRAASTKLLEEGPNLSNEEFQGWFAVEKSCLEIFYSLSVVDIPAELEESLASTTVPVFRRLLAFTDKRLVCDDDVPGELEELKTQLCDILKLYADKYLEQFSKWIPSMVEGVMACLSSLPSKPCYDGLVASAVLFLSAVARPQWENEEDPFHLCPSLLESLCQHVVLPNVKLREEDVELVVDNPFEFVRRELEGTDEGSRRGSVMELVRALNTRFEDQVRETISKYVSSLLEEAAKPGVSPQDADIYREASTYLVMALSIRTSTRALGASTVSAKIDVAQYFKQQLVESVQAPDPRSPLVTLSALKFARTFRRHFSKEDFNAILPYAAELIKAPAAAIQTYAAACVSAFVTSTDETGASRIDGAAIPCLIQAMDTCLNLILPVGDPHTPVGEGGTKVNCNEYVMRCAHRILLRLKDAGEPWRAMESLTHSVTQSLSLTCGCE
eukprot:GHVU01179056.1.p1 GENE.GHVU01179056.1~~GHVU01179056.1.p1  ORF type:complete len:628 (+),score=104.08 GHVU01179056.1:67-1950(+)